MGIKLNTARMRLMKTILANKSDMPGPIKLEKNLNIKPNASAMRMFEAGPAMATLIGPYF